LDESSVPSNRKKEKEERKKERKKEEEERKKEEEFSVWLAKKERNERDKVLSFSSSLMILNFFKGGYLTNPLAFSLIFCIIITSKDSLELFNYLPHFSF
jgi:hypothetical protein